MSETRRPDPLRRDPPVIDLPSGQFREEKRDGAPPGPTATGPAEPPAEGASAIEPVAATGLGPNPFPKDSKADPAASGPKSPAGAAGASGGGKPVPDAKPSSDAKTSPNANPAAETKPVTPSAASLGAGKGAGTPAAGGPAAAGPAAAAAAKSAVPPSSGPPKTGSGPAPSAPAAAAGRPAKSRGAGSLLAASVLGGLVGAGLTLGAERYLLPPRQDPAMLDRMATLESRLAALPAGSPASSGLEPRIAALEAGLKETAAAAQASRAAAEAAAKQVGEALGRPGPAASAPAPDTGLREAVTALTARLDESAGQARANATAIGELGTRVEALGTRSGEGLQAVQAAVTALQGGVQALQAEVQALKTGTGALDTRTGQAEARLATMSTELGRMSGDLAKLSPAAVQAGLRVVIAGRIEDALRAGTPLGPTLQPLARFGTDPAAIAALQPFAETPAPSAGALAAEFKPLAEQMTAVPRPPAETWLDRVRRVFEKVVTVRAVGDGSGTDLPGLVSRIEAALGRGQLAEAAGLWDQLPAPAKAMSESWAGRLKARVAAEAAARSISQAALAALDGASR
ncbi:hypothetical protein [Enterovirga sp.]|uniref:COG4223 family protein n=1 Tax=Enterovirga sp. TaxID=2026350 RepID=UPI002625D569|nr:hypothetical protein [Enterovirga sp.]